MVHSLVHFSITLFYALVFLAEHVTGRATGGLNGQALSSHKGPKALKCPLDDVGIFLVVDEAQFPLLGHLMASMDMFLPCYGSMQVIADRKDLSKVPAWINLDRPGLRLHIMDDFVPAALKHLSGYILQQWIMMWADKFMPPKIKHVMYFDSDVVFAVPVVRDLLFDAENKPYVGFQEYPPFHTQFESMCSSFLGVDCPHGSSMTFFPYIYPAGALKSFRRFVTRNWSSRWFDEAFLKWSAAVGEFKTSEFSQFVVMGNFIVDHHPESIHKIFCPNIVAGSPPVPGNEGHATVIDTAESIGECATYIPVGVHMGWRYCGLFNSCSSNSTDIKAFQANTFSKKYRKWGQPYIDGAENIISSGYCFKHFSLNGVIKPGCTREQANLLHDEVFSYPGLTAKASVSEHVRSLIAKGWWR